MRCDKSRKTLTKIAPPKSKHSTPFNPLNMQPVPYRPPNLQCAIMAHTLCSTVMSYLGRSLGRSEYSKRIVDSKGTAEVAELGTRAR